MKLVILFLAASISFAASDDEFVGPFPSWTNLVTTYGTSNANIQQAFNELGTTGHNHNLWVPCGTYNITGLTMPPHEGVAVIGEDPSCVTFLLTSGNTLLHVNGIDYSKINRIKFDGNGNTSAVLIDQFATGPGTFFDTGNEYADDIFQNAGWGFRCGWLVNGCSEISILRDNFTTMSKACVFVGNYNALDIWVRYSIFTGCNTGVGNYDGTNVGAGNFHVYNSNFFSSTLSDISIGNTTPFSIRGGYFKDSPYAILAAGTGNPAPMTVMDSTFIDQTTQVANVGNQGPILFMDNSARQLSATLPAAFLSSDAVTVSNRFTLGPNPIATGNRLYEIGTSIVSSGSINATPPTLPGVQPNLGRTIFEVAVGANTAAIQTAINSAVALNGNRPVVHLPEGSYNITVPLVIPPCDLQLIGDGSFATFLNWTGTGTGPVISISGPSHATFKDFRINANLQVDGISVSNIDQVGARVFMHGVQVGADGLAANANIFYDGLDNTVLDAEDIGHSASLGTGLKVTGGPAASIGSSVGGMVRIFDSSGGDEILPNQVSNGGTLLLRDNWNESQGPAFANISGRAQVTLDGVHAFLSGNVGQAIPGIAISNLNGKVAILTSNPQDRTLITGTGSQVLQSAGDQDCPVTSPYFIDNSSPVGISGLLIHRECTTTVPGTGSIPTANIGNSDPTFVQAMLAQDRAAQQAPLTTLAASITDLRMYRLSINRGINGIHLFNTQQCISDSNGFVVTGLSATQNNILGPLTCYGTNPWLFGDLAEVGIINNMAPAALAETPTLSTALAGTVSFSGFGSTVTTTADLRTPLMGQSYVAFAWNSSDGAGTGRHLCAINSVTANSITCQSNIFTGAFSGIIAYLMPPADIHGWTFLSWTATSPSVSWNYYDAAIGLYRSAYRTNSSTFLSYARQYADIQWQWVIDHGYAYPYPRAASMISQFYRATENHSERYPGLYAEVSKLVQLFGDPTASPAIDNREAGYTLWDVALGAKTDPNSTRHAQYCSWLSTYVPIWNSKQYSDGSWGQAEYFLNPSFVSAPKSFTPPIQYGASPWREAINIKAMEAAYESLNDTSSQGCNNTSLATATLTKIISAVTWQNNFGRDTSNRGVYYEVNSQSNEQATVYPGAGTVSVSLNSTAIVGIGTDFVAKCAAAPFIGINSSRTVYKLAACSDNTHATLSVAYGLYGESSNAVNSAVAYAPAASTTCNSSATQCYDGVGDRNLTRTVCDGIAWVYQTTLNATYKTWTDECLSAQLGGPTAGLTSAASIGSNSLPCSGTACDGLVTDTLAAAPSCSDTSNVPPCVQATFLYGNLGKNFGEAFGAPSIDNALARRLYASANPLTCQPKTHLATADIRDIQLQTSMALGTANCTNNLKQSGTCNIIDIQRVASNAHGKPCKIGP